ncbi:acyl-CoA desaturase [Betaproteobacteria bacterium PRO7]|jgi:stearoyl-CoA desaturase (delta-9 desaturase)|nr:acyl-CoA desaturase [Betaproteobacteria bacterium PRO7]
MYLFEFLDGGLLGLSWWQLVLATLALTHVTIASVTIFLHRSQAHRGLDLHPIASHFFRLWLWLTTGMQTKEWVAIHRKHHAKCETEDDPHSPQTRGLKKVLWEGAELYMVEAKNRETLAKYGHGTPNDWLERNVYSRFTWQGVGIMLGIDLVLFGAAGIAVWAVQMVWIPFFAAGVINGLGHFWGYRNYDAPDASTNISPWGILIGGEELHNNHHTFPTSAKLSSKWYEFDLGWAYIRILETLGLAKVLRVAPVPKVAEPKRLVDLETLQAVINNRYDLLARYARDLRRAYAEELRKMRLSAAERDRFAAVKRWLRKSDVAALPEPQRQTLTEALAQSRVLKTLVDMRAELKAIWERSSASREQMLAHLQDWIARAEASGIRALQDVALRIRSYAPVAA